MPGDGFVFGAQVADWKFLVPLILLFNLLVLAEIPPANAQAWLDSELRNRHDRSRFYSEDAPRLKARSTACGFPWTYSRGLHRCVCVRTGYSIQQGACAADGASASSMEPKLAAADPATPVDPRAEATLRAQSCLQQLGFYKGPVDGVVNDDTWTAFWYFKRGHGLKSHRDFVDAPVQEKFASLCKSPEQTATATPAANAGVPTPSEAGLSEHAIPPAKEVTPSFTPIEIDCVPANLLAQLRQSRVGGNALKACTESCLPAPKGLAQADLDALAARHGLHWCNSCVTIEGQLPLADIRRIEKAGNLQLCATPPNQLPQASGLDADGAAYTRIRELYRGLPPAGPPENAIALVIGNRNYESYPHDETAANEAGAVYAFLTEHLGYSPDNVIDVRDTKKLELERLFGAGEEADSTLSRLAQEHPGANVIVYYAGLGATDEAQSETYLLPVDGEHFREERSGYKLATLYANLQKLGAKSVLVLLEADFGREQGPYLLPPNAPETTRSVLPSSPLPGVSVLAAADRGQRRLIDPTYGVGLFTRYLIEGLSGEADRTPLGNGNGAVDSGEIFAYSAIMTELAARKSFGLMQNPIYSGTVAPVIARSSRD